MTRLPLNIKTRLEKRMSIKKALLLVGMLCATMAHAASFGEYNTCSDSNNVVPCEADAWGIAIEGLYFQNNGNSLVGEAFGGRLTVLINDNYTYKPKFGAGYRIEGSYHFGTGNDLTLVWSHYKTTSDANVAGNSSFTQRFSLESQFEILNLEFGQSLAFGEKLNFRAHGGIQIAELKEDWSQDVDNNGVPNNNGTLLSTDMNKPSGAGIRVGLDSYYDVGRGISIFVRTAGAILYMENKHTGGPRGLTNAFWASGTETITSLAPEVELSIGAKYAYEFDEGDLSIRLGWEEIVYFNTAFLNSSLSWNGGVIGFKWVGNA
jgi:hypothetical protein